MQNSLPVSLYLDTRRALTSGENKERYPVYVRVEFGTIQGKRQQPMYHTGVYLTESQFAKAISESPGRALRDVAVKLVGFKAKAVEIIKDSPVINPELFELYFTGKAVRSANVEILFKMHIAKFDKAGKIKSRDSYDSAMNSILDFVDGKVCPKCKAWYNPMRMEIECSHDRKEGRDPSGLLLNNIDKDLLERYERWMIASGNSVTSVGIYLRNVRAVFNDAIDVRHVISRELYPFGKRGYRIPTGKKVKKALPDNPKARLLKYRATDPGELEALDFWKFSYYCDGMNPIDIAYLHEDKIGKDSFSYVRKKTETTERTQTDMIVHMHPEVRSILKRRGLHSPYVFGIITPDMSPERKRRSVENFVKRINKNISKIADKLGLPRVTTYTARHTAATTYLRKGVDLKTIQERLGHDSIATTEAYLDSIDSDDKKKLHRLL